VSPTDQGEPGIFPGWVEEGEASLGCFFEVGGRGSNFPRGTGPQGVRKRVVYVEVHNYQEGYVQGRK